MASVDHINDPRHNNVSRETVDPGVPHNLRLARTTPNDRDPHTHGTAKRTDGGGKWFWIALAVVAGVMLLLWLLGTFSGP